MRELPLGAQRQVAFLAALAHSPEVLVLDEPTSGVNVLASAALWDTSARRPSEGAGVLVTTHYMQEAQQCDRLLLMSNGQLVAQGSEADIVGSTTAVAVHTERLGASLRRAQRRGCASHAGRAGRSGWPMPTRPSCKAVLTAAGIEATLQPVPATIEERMLVLARATEAS